MEKRNLFIGMGILIVVLVLFTGVSSYPEEARGVTGKSVKIGLMADLTGPIADVWNPVAHGIKAYFKMINDRGGIHGRKIEYVFEDDRYSIPLALSSFKKLVYRDKVFNLLGASGVGHTAAIIPLVEKEKIPLIALTAEKRFYYPARKYIFCPIIWYSDHAKLFVEYVFHDLKLKDPTIVLMYPDAASGKDTRDTIRELVKAYPVKNYEESVFSMVAVDFTSEIMRLKQLKPDIIYIHGFIVQSGSIVKTARRFGLSAPIIVSQYACTNETIKIAGEKASDLVGINSFGTWDDDSPGVKELRKASLAYDPGVHYQGSNFFQGWFMAMLFCKGFENAGRDLNRESFANGLEAMKDFDTQGICGVVSFGANDHKSIESARFLKADIGKKLFVPITGWRVPKKYDF
ncbi:MAG: ABC transporter substrate-binding protein [Thermodesulfobacteriota bacterium]